MKRGFVAVLCAAALLVAGCGGFVFGHGGGLDRYGCHTESATGDYHCHNDTPSSCGDDCIIGIVVASVAVAGLLAFIIWYAYESSPGGSHVGPVEEYDDTNEVAERECRKDENVASCDFTLRRFYDECMSSRNATSCYDAIDLNAWTCRELGEFCGLLWGYYDNTCLDTTPDQQLIDIYCDDALNENERLCAAGYPVNGCGSRPTPTHQEPLDSAPGW